MHNHRPDLTEPPPHRKKKGAQAKGAPETPLKEADPDSWRIIQKIRKLESDILFDKEDAHEQWADLRIRLIKDAAERKKVLGENIEPPKNADHVSSHPLQPQLFESTESKHVQSDDDETVGVGEFFSNLPEQIVNKSGTSGSVSTTINGASIMVRDFGKWAGMSPRRVFEEACKARDSGVKVSYDPMSTVSFSARHSLTVHWSRAQEMPPLESIGGVSWKGDSRTAHLEMTDMSTLDSMQSEAYISTVSLFILFVSSPKEERTYLRLPSVWRSLWDELTIERQRRLDKADRLELKELRKLVEDHSDETNVLDISLDASSLRSPTATTASIAFLSLHTIAEDMGHQLASLWAAKASNPAFQRMARSRMALPIWNYRDELLAAIESHQVIIICGETGCGKSTQVPSFLLEHELSNGRPCKIYCTEPRRISAISLARRVSEELGERRSDVGTTRSLVGYAIRLESHITPLTRLVYATTGIVMRMLEGSEDLSEITHLVLDEVHERSIDSDFLLIILRKLMRRRPSLKVILMSATVNAEHFSQYLGGCPVMNVPGRTFPVNTLYLEDAIEVTNYGDNNNSEGGGFPDEDYEADEEGETKQSTAANELVGYSTRTRNFLLQFNEYRIDYSLIVDLLATIATNGQYVEYSEAILVFLPGLAEIRKLNSMLSGHWCFLNWEIFALHSTIATEDQERAFIVPPPGIRKIVLATNIAETGITIPDITCVVDTGKHKEMRSDNSSSPRLLYD